MTIFTITTKQKDGTVTTKTVNTEDSLKDQFTKPTEGGTK
jgi:hypothetical protein